MFEDPQLNPEQRKAVLHNKDALLILAGAGSGKTRVITVKIAWFIEKLGMDPRSILALTFTNKAAQEMRERAGALSPAAEQVLIRTFHSFGAWLLRRNQAALDLADNFSIYDDNDSLALLASLYPDRSRDQLTHWNRLISRMKNNCVSPADAPGDADFREAYGEYEERLREIGNVDFGDLILRPIELLKNEQEIAGRIRARFSVILVDEYQDSNLAQCNLLKALYSPGAYICVVGDDDQSIYRFRGAELRNILDFPRQFDNADIIKLEQNYRSTAPILKLAGSVVNKNQGRLGKELWTERKGGQLPFLAMLTDQDAEADYVTEILQDGFSGETAILYRTNAQSRLFETKFLREDIPYRIIGTVRFYDREEIRDAIALLKLLANPKDEVAFTRIVNKPARGVGPVTVRKILSSISLTGGNLIQAAEHASTAGKAGIKSFVELMKKAQSLFATAAGGSGDGAGGGGGQQQKNLGELLDDILQLSGLPEHYMARDEIAGAARLQNLEELINAASVYSSANISDFLESVELDSVREQNDPDAKTILVTMHNTKGLEFDRVIITGLEDGLFPRADNLEELEEERRLFYVSITRAKEELHMTCCASRIVHGRTKYLSPSIFLSEIDDSLIEQGGNILSSTQLNDPWHHWQDNNPHQSHTHHSRPHQSHTHHSHTHQSHTHQSEPSTDDALCEYAPGQRIFHDDYGSGEVIKSSHNGSREIILVRFDTGRTGQFVARYSPIEKISSD